MGKDLQAVNNLVGFIVSSHLDTNTYDMQRQSSNRCSNDCSLNFVALHPANTCSHIRMGTNLIMTVHTRDDFYNAALLRDQATGTINTQSHYPDSEQTS